MQAFLIFVLISCVAALKIWSIRMQRSGEWHAINTNFQMRRWINGEWQYRDMTPEEKDRHIFR